MSRIQQILEKAEREGALHRTGPLHRARGRLASGTPLETLEAVGGEGLETDEQSSAGSSRSAPGSPNRVLVTSDLDRCLIASAPADGPRTLAFSAGRSRRWHRMRLP